MKTKSTSPKGGKKGCLCEDGTYSNECCKGETLNQGIGNTENNTVSNVVNVDTTRVLVRSNS
jgi:hypothetical protein